MKRISWIGGVLAVVGYLWLKDKPARSEAAVASDADPGAILKLVEQVEREPEFIPAVRSVRLERRDGNEAVYRVEAKIAGVPGSARFRKRVIERESRAEWTTLEGVLGFRQDGGLDVRRSDGRTVVSVRAETRFLTPVVGPFLARLSAPFLTLQFRLWLQNLSREAQATRSEAAPARGENRPGPSQEKE
jgi:hypothetical protein